MSTVVSVRLKNSLAEMDRLHEYVHNLGAALALPQDVIFSIDLALDEIVTNIINYGYDDANEHLITIEGLREGKALRLTVRDDAKQFNPLIAKEPDLTLGIDDRPIGGLGIHLVKNFMTKLEYAWEDNHNNLVMWKDLPD